MRRLLVLITLIVLGFTACGPKTPVADFDIYLKNIEYVDKWTRIYHYGVHNNSKNVGYDDNLGFYYCDWSLEPTGSDAEMRVGQLDITRSDDNWTIDIDCCITLYVDGPEDRKFRMGLSVSNKKGVSKKIVEQKWRI